MQRVLKYKYGTYYLCFLLSKRTNESLLQPRIRQINVDMRPMLGTVIDVPEILQKQI